MKKYLLSILTILVLVGLTGFAIYKHDNRSQPTSPLATAQLGEKTLQNELISLQLHDTIDSKNLTNTQNALSIVTSQKTQLCTLAKAHELATANLCD